MSDDGSEINDPRLIPTSSTPPPYSDRQPSKGAAAILQFWLDDHDDRSLLSTLTDPQFAAQFASEVEGVDDVEQVTSWAQEALSFLPREAQASMLFGLSGMSEEVEGLASGSRQEEFQQFVNSAMQDAQWKALADSMCVETLAEALRQLEVDHSAKARPQRKFTADTVTTSMSSVFDANGSEDTTMAYSPFTEDLEYDETDEQVRQGVEGKEFL
ncbi:hypothetical protein L198_02953 [Cryptococcus wingfieldii CBS 7118]|uniref:Uncharacterized protein n=1 Tax=Cryptococcus wingfieldii CBS 7118 TaxID=1295528 RepID=A0A1E3JL28_9TREE|nr:hypothetical protein L198_02953 [Cryptococcus wingfieldii CBS 7118]ODO00632.1 hypothetical protein L198_02953 [Cryptococcus wingfieldii CBS 7118]